MLTPEEIASASATHWGHIKLAAQILSYVGLAATTCLGVFDFLYDQKGKVPNRHHRFSLNLAGEKHLRWYIAIASLTIISTVTKDFADYKLSGMASESAKADLRKALGENLDSFAKNALAPSVHGITQDIENQRAAFDNNIKQSTQQLDKALKKTEADLSQSTSEAAADAELSDVKVEEFFVAVSVGPHSIKLGSPKPPALLFAWHTLLVEKCTPPQVSDLKTQAACNNLKRLFQQLGYMR